MINVSKEFQLLMNEYTDFKENAEITFADGTFLELSKKDFTVSNNSVVDSAGSNGIPLGVALCRSIQIELMNDDNRFSIYDFFGAKIRLYLTFSLSETVERVEYGTFTVLTPETYGETVIITALDDMHKADKEYNTTLAFPTTIGNILRDACVTLGISQGTTSFLNDNFVVNEQPADITFRQLFGYIAMIAGGNARIDRTGRLRIHTYDFSNMESIYNSVLNGGSYNPWDNPSNYDGGSFSPWNTGDSLDGGEFEDRNHFHVLGNWSNLKVDTDDIVITGVKTEYEDENEEKHTVIYGAEGYVLRIDNPLIVGKEKTAIDLIGNIMVGGRFRQFSGDIVANPTCEFMDTVLLLDRKGNVYISFLTDINFQFFGFTSIKNSAEPTLRNSAKTYSEATKTFVKAKKLVDKERTAREKAVEQLAKDLSESSGLYVTTEKQSDGSTIYYMHDKPTLKESMIVWKLTALAFGISTDGGETYPYGFTVDGETITRLLYADGIDVKNLVVGENVQMGPKATISWANVTDKENVANKSDIPNKTSQLTNDSDFAYTEDIPTKTSQLTNDSNLAYSRDIPTKLSQLTNDNEFITASALPTDDEICDIILENRGTIITKEYIGTLKVVAGSVAAEDITGTTITGKNIVTPSEDGRNIKLFYGGMYFYHNEDMAGGLSINFQENYPGVFLHNQGGRFVGIAIGTKEDGSDLTPAYKASPYETIKNQFFGGAKFGISNYTIINDHSIESHYSTGNTLIEGAKIKVSGLTTDTTIEPGTLKALLGTNDYLNINGKELTSYGGTSDYSILDGKKITSFGSTYNYTEVEGAKIYLFNGTTQNLTIESDLIYLYGGYSKTLSILSDGFDFDGTLSIKQGTTSLMEFTSSNVTIKGSNTYLGASGGYLGFFGTTTKSTKKSVSTIASTSSATASTNATKINEIINALKAYNLI